MKKIIIFILASLVFSVTKTSGQNLLSLLDSIQPENNEILYTQYTFSNVRLINGYTSETASKKELYFSVSHRFTEIKKGIYDFFGLDQNTMHLGLEYGLSDRIDLGIGRSSFEKLYDGFIKIKILQQSSGLKHMPVTLTWQEGMSVKTQKWFNEDVDYPFSARLYYVHELFIARKFNDKLSLQLSPVIIHRNMVRTTGDQNIVGALGLGGTYRIARRLLAVCEYYYLFAGKTADQFNNSLSLGVDIETGGGHVFQLHLTNSSGMTEKTFIPETKRNWKDGDIIFGFNIIRLFSFK